MRPTALILLAALACTLPACGKKDPPQAPPAKAQAVPANAAAERNKAFLAVESVRANLGALQDGGGYQSWTAETAAAKLVTLMNAAQAPGPDMPQASGQGFTYVADKVTAPWQVVIRADGKSLVVAAYGSNIDQALEERTFEVSRY